VEAAAALRRDLERQTEQMRVLLMWQQAAKGSDRRAQRNRNLAKLEGQLAVVHEFIESEGGWRAAVFLGPGRVNIDVSAAAPHRLLARAHHFA
jgi:hypothetical protein